MIIIIIIIIIRWKMGARDGEPKKNSEEPRQKKIEEQHNWDERKHEQ